MSNTKHTHTPDGTTDESKFVPWPVISLDQLASLRLRQFRKREGLTMKGARQRIWQEAGWHLSEPVYQALESPKNGRRWTLDDLAAVCVAFSVTLDQLLLPPKEPDADWSDVVGRVDRIAAFIEESGQAHNNEDIRRSAELDAEEHRTMVTTHRSIDFSLDPSIDFSLDFSCDREKLSGLLFGVKAAYLESARRDPEGAYIEALSNLQAISTAVAKAVAQFELEDS